MNTFNKEFITVEVHCLKRPDEQLRLQKQGALERLMQSLEKYGQQQSVIIVPNTDQSWTLIDGHMRIKALQRLGCDTVDAEVWHCDKAEALLMLLASKQARPLEIIEQAQLLRELQITHKLSLSTIASRLGKSKSWVNYRLNLLGDLPKELLTAIYNQALSTWSATRILIPFARANAQHAEEFLQYLTKNKHSTRDIQNYYKDYQQSNREVRTKMVEQPELYFKAQKLMIENAAAKRVQAGPEGNWETVFMAIKTHIIALQKLAPAVIHARLKDEESKVLLTQFNDAKTQFDLLTETIRRLTDGDK